MSDNVAVRMTRKLVTVHEEDNHAGDKHDGQLWRRVGGKLGVTPLFITVMVILSVDLVFALDSIPAIFGITQNSYIVFTANAFALLGLRALYFLLVGLLERLVHLSYGLSFILAFIGVKLILHCASTSTSIRPSRRCRPGSRWCVILATLTVVTITSLYATRGEPAEGRRLRGERGRGRTPGRPGTTPAPPGRPTRPRTRRGGRDTVGGVTSSPRTGP